MVTPIEMKQEVAHSDFKEECYGTKADFGYLTRRNGELAIVFDRTRHLGELEVLKLAKMTSWLPCLARPACLVCSVDRFFVLVSLFAS